MPEETVKRVKMKPYQSGFMRSKARFPNMTAGWGTGKTMFPCCLKPIEQCLKYPGNEWLIVRKERTRLDDSTIPDFERHTNYKYKVDSKGNVKIRNPEWPKDAPDSLIMFRHGEQINRSEVLQNMNLGGFSIEQAEEFETDREFQMLRGRLRRDGVPHWGCISANTKGHNWIYKLWKKKDLPVLTDSLLKEQMAETGLTEEQLREAYNPGQYELFEATTYDNKSNLSLDFLQDIARLKVESPHHYNRFAMNSWEDVDTEDKVIPYSHIMRAINKSLLANRQKTLISCDPKEFGNDECVIYGMVNGEIKRHKFFMREMDGSHTAAECQIMRKEMKAQGTVLDNIGIGASTRDFLVKMEEPVILADARLKAENVSDAIGFFNLRAKMWWEAKQAFARDEVSIPDDPKLIEELAAPSYEITPRGYKIESKEILKKADRLGHSPNRAECLVFNLWGQTQIDYDDEAIYPDDEFYLPECTDVAESYSMRTNA